MGVKFGKCNDLDRPLPLQAASELDFSPSKRPAGLGALNFQLELESDVTLLQSLQIGSS
ncbi:hypothetical protein PGT21_018129 [Puccinia graminis f. sp. tritici]|uniref:Uncharacterized protein n=1 Tax=Puccinia graminis f. sp. tritici TaxID=56615 RepID=A0A5B0N906_PUCGR|nr:hypothetical protein PGT21_018129 [Puccinia graminis f. sp. tritici]KAA1136151.1 hypothetical protein PGTUg99_033676 [Puccinia graminis f. sp. tritici]